MREVDIDLLGKDVVAIAGDTGEVVFRGRVLGYADKPTFLIELEDGSQRHWVSSLTRSADVDWR